MLGLLTDLQAGTVSYHQYNYFSIEPFGCMSFSFIVWPGCHEHGNSLSAHRGKAVYIWRSLDLAVVGASCTSLPFYIFSSYCHTAQFYSTWDICMSWGISCWCLSFIGHYGLFWNNSHFFGVLIYIWWPVRWCSRYMAYIMDTNEEERIKVWNFGLRLI